MKIISSYVLAILLLVFGGAAAQATTYYVDSAAGSDANSGKALTVPFATIQAASNVTNPGDTVYILPGKGYCQGYTTPPAGCIDITRSGSAGGGYITYSGFPGMPYPVINGQKNYAAIIIDSPVSYITLQNLNVAGWNGDLTLAGAWTAASNTGSWFTQNNGYNGFGIWTAQSNDTTLTTNALTASGNTLHFASGPASILVGCIVADVTAPRTAAIATGTTITAVGTSTTLSANVAAQVNSGDSIQVNCPSHHINILNNIVHDFPAGGIYTATADYLTVSGNIVYNNAWYSPLGASGIQIYASRDVDTNTGLKTQITGNVSYNNYELVPALFVLNNGYATNATTATSSNVLHFNGTTNNPVTGACSTSGCGSNVPAQNLFYVLDTTTPSAIVAGTYVTAFTSTTVTMSNNATGAGVGSGDRIVLSYTSDGEGTSIDDNSNDQTGGNAYAGQTLVSNNLTFGNGSAGVQSFDSHNVSLTFNTSYSNQISAFLAATNQGEISNQQDVNSIVANNIANASGTTNSRFSDASTSHTFVGNNLCFGGLSSQTCSGSGNVTSNPSFVNPSVTPPTFYAPYVTNGLPPLSQFFTGFQLQASSPAIDAGTSSYTRSTDILGNPGLVGPKYDMGAYEGRCSSFGGSGPAYSPLQVSAWCGTVP